MMVPLGPAMALLVALAVKHFIADFLLQTEAIARGKAAMQGWFWPLSVHAFAHALITLVIVLVVHPPAWWLAPAEWVVHASIDRIKVVVGRETAADLGTPRFWWLFGFDQMLHHLTNIAIAGVLLGWIPPA